MPGNNGSKTVQNPSAREQLSFFKRLKRYLASHHGYDWSDVFRILGPTALDIAVACAEEEITDPADFLLGKYYVTPKQLNEVGFNYSNDELKFYAENKPNIRTLRLANEAGMVLIPGPPNSDMNLHDIKEHISQEDCQFNLGLAPGNIRQGFLQASRVRCNTWYTMSRHPVFMNLSWLEQLSKVAGNDFCGNPPIANAAEVFWLLHVFKVVNGQDLFGRTLSRTFSLSDNEESEISTPVVVGCNGGQPRIICNLSDDSYGCVGTTLVRRFGRR